MNFLIQYILTIATIILIPLLLWYGKQRNISKLTYLAFAILIITDVVAYLMLDRFPSYVYLAVITFISLFFVKRAS
jgi:hypothetical protein